MSGFEGLRSPTRSDLEAAVSNLRETLLLITEDLDTSGWAALAAWLSGTRAGASLSAWLSVPRRGRTTRHKKNRAAGPGYSPVASELLEVQRSNAYSCSPSPSP